MASAIYSYLRLIITLQILDCSGNQEIKYIKNTRIESPYDVHEMMGEKMCIRQCRIQKSCRSVNFNRMFLKCELNLNITDGTPGTFVTDNDFTYIELHGGNQEVEPVVLNSTCRVSETVCLEMKNGDTFCTEKGRNRNVASYKNGSSSSILREEHSTEYATDNKSPIISHYEYCFITEPEESPWYRVDLGSEYNVGCIVVQSGYGWPLKDAEVRVGTTADWTSMEICDILNGTSTTFVDTFTCRPPIKGRFMQLTIESAEYYLIICEVLVIPN